MRYTEYVERKFPPSSDRQTSLILFSFSFPLFFRTAKALRRSGIPLPGAERFRLSGRAVFRRNKSFKLCSKTVHTLRCGVRYTNIVSKGSRNPDEADDLPIFLFLFFTPFYFVNDGKRPELVPPRAGVFFCPFEGKCALIVAPALLIIFQRLFKNGSHIGAESAVY